MTAKYPENGESLPPSPSNLRTMASSMARPSPKILATLVVALAVAVHVPALCAGFFADDYLHQLALSGELPMSPWALYDFGSVADWSEMHVERFGFPWWTSPEWKVRFFRPLASLSLALDHSVFGRNAMGYAFTGLVLYAATLALALRLFRVLGLGPRISVGALALFSCSASTTLAVGWAANRNSLLELFFALLATLAAWTGARERRMGRLALAWVCATAAAATKESGVVLFPLVAIAIVMARPTGTGRPAWLVLAGGLFPAAAWTLGLALGEYGTRCLFYVTPWEDPVGFLERLTMLFPLTALHLLTPLSADLPFLAPDSTPLVVGLGVLAGIAGIVWGSKRLPDNAPFRFLLLWSVLTLAPQAGAPPSDRLLLIPMVALAPLLAVILAEGLRRGGRERTLARIVVVSAGVLSMLGLFAQRVTIGLIAGEVREAVTTADVGDRNAGPREVFVLQSGSAFVPFAMATTWHVETDDRDVRFWPLQMGRCAVDWRRIDQRTFEVVAVDEPLLTGPFEYLYRWKTLPAKGEVYRTPLFEAEVTEADESGVRAFRVRLDVDPDGETIRFLAPDGDRMVALPLPDIGRTLRLERARAPRPLTP